VLASLTDSPVLSPGNVSSPSGPKNRPGADIPAPERGLCPWCRRELRFDPSDTTVVCACGASTATGAARLAAPTPPAPLSAAEKWKRALFVVWMLLVLGLRVGACVDWAPPVTERPRAHGAVDPWAG